MKDCRLKKLGYTGWMAVADASQLAYFFARRQSFIKIGSCMLCMIFAWVNFHYF